MRYRYFILFWLGVSVFANFSYVIAENILDNPQIPPHPPTPFYHLLPKETTTTYYY